MTDVLTWNYRVIRHEDCVGIHEVYYDDAGKPIGYAEFGGAVVGDDLAELGRVLDKMRDALSKPELDETLAEISV